jgi:hypothetical protein
LNIEQTILYRPLQPYVRSVLYICRT